MKVNVKFVVRRALLELLGPFVMVGVGLEKTYHFVFRQRIIRQSLQEEQQFARDIQRDLKFLFDDYCGRIVPDDTVEHPQPFDFAFAIVALEDLSFRFLRGRGSFEAWVAPRFAPKEWGELQWVLNMVDGPDPFEPRDFLSLNDIANLIKPRMIYIREAFSVERYPQTRQYLLDMRSHERAVARQLGNEISRRLQG